MGKGFNKKRLTSYHVVRLFKNNSKMYMLAISVVQWSISFKIFKVLYQNIKSKRQSVLDISAVVFTRGSDSSIWIKSK